jgi:uncharacterized YigZ family protein
MTHPPDDAPSGSSDRYLVMTDGPEVETRVKGSRFVGQALEAHGEDEARARLETIRKRHHDATHHCSAWWIGPPGRTIERSDDDGEPSGTAGAPILHPLRGSGRHDGMVVVTRWFGGTKLGAGGLVRAYGECAAEAIAAAGARTVWITRVFEVEVSYEDVGVVEAVLARHERTVRDVERHFEGTPRFVVRALASGADPVVAALVEATGARAHVSHHEGGADRH